MRTGLAAAEMPLQGSLGAPQYGEHCRELAANGYRGG